MTGRVVVRGWALLGAHVTKDHSAHLGPDGLTFYVGDRTVTRSDFDTAGAADFEAALYALTEVTATWARWRITMILTTTVVDGRLTATGMRWSGPVEAADLRALAGDLATLVRIGHAAGWHPDGDDASVRDVAGRLPGRARRRRLTPAFLAGVAEVYLAGGTRGKANVTAVYNVPASTADRWVRAARDGGHLGQAPGPRRAGQREDNEQ